MESRNFKLDTEWNMIHYPEKPTGFGILIIGDERHFVDKDGSFWTQNEGKWIILNNLKNAGYTVFYSNLYGRHWGAERAVKLAKSLYEYIIRTEIINDKIHLLAEGMGALVALKLIQEMKENIRSVILINPVLSLKDHLELEKEHKFFYKRLVKEIANSYHLDSSNIMDYLEDQEQKNFLSMSDIPIKIIHILEGGRSHKQSRYLSELSDQWKEMNAPVRLTFLVPEKKFQLSSYMLKFYQHHERKL